MFDIISILYESCEVDYSILVLMQSYLNLYYYDHALQIESKSMYSIAVKIEK